MERCVFGQQRICPVNCKLAYLGAAGSQGRAFPRFGEQNAEFGYSTMPDVKVIVLLLITLSYFIENTPTHTKNTSFTLIRTLDSPVT